jgi:hypothetical protein
VTLLSEESDHSKVFTPCCSTCLITYAVFGSECKAERGMSFCSRSRAILSRLSVGRPGVEATKLKHEVLLCVYEKGVVSILEALRQSHGSLVHHGRLWLSEPLSLGGQARGSKHKVRKAGPARLFQ